MSLYLNERPLAEYRHNQDRRALARRTLERTPGEGQAGQWARHAVALEAQHLEHERRTGSGRRAWDGVPDLG